MTEATAAQFALTIIACMYAVWMAICLRQTRKELNDLKSRMAKPGDVSRLIEQYERGTAKHRIPARQGIKGREGQEPPKPKTYSMPVPVPECWKPHKAHDIVREMENNAKNQFISDCMNQTQSSATYFSGGDFGGAGDGDSYGSSSSND